MSGIRLPGCSKLAVNWNDGSDIIIFRHYVIVNFFDIALFLLSSLVAGPSSGFGVMTISFYKGLKSRNRKYLRLSFVQYLEIGESKEYQIWHERP